MSKKEADNFKMIALKLSSKAWDINKFHLKCRKNKRAILLIIISVLILF